jgi:hypothetical protein
MKPKVGLRFNHARLLSTEKFDGHTPQICQVTRIAAGHVFYRPVYDIGESGERFGFAQCCPVLEFGRWAREIVS